MRYVVVDEEDAIRILDQRVIQVNGSYAVAQYRPGIETGATRLAGTVAAAIGAKSLLTGGNVGSGAVNRRAKDPRVAGGRTIPWATVATAGAAAAATLYGLLPTTTVSFDVSILGVPSTPTIFLTQLGMAMGRGFAKDFWTNPVFTGTWTISRSIEERLAHIEFVGTGSAAATVITGALAAGQSVVNAISRFFGGGGVNVLDIPVLGNIEDTSSGIWTRWVNFKDDNWDVNSFGVNERILLDNYNGQQPAGLSTSQPRSSNELRHGCPVQLLAQTLFGEGTVVPAVTNNAGFSLQGAWSPASDQTKAV
jgi:hypothetical protein